MPFYFCVHLFFYFREDYHSYKVGFVFCFSLLMYVECDFAASKITCEVIDENTELLEGYGALTPAQE